MCGLVGFYSPSGGCELPSLVARAMADAIVHRGPDDSGVWVDERIGFAMGHRRLAVLELSPAGAQPMVSACGRYVLAFNGEIYNHLELRSQLEHTAQGPVWRGHSDTETLLACVSAWGVVRTLGALVGMFALALFDRETLLLTLARDRMGEKPLYYGSQDGALLFGSELKALRAWSEFRAQIDRDALTQLLRHSYIPSPYSVYTGIRKLMPGHYLEVSLAPHSIRNWGEPVAYWALNEVVARGLAAPFEGTADEAVDALEAQLRASIREQMLADVPLGALLSGGIDSSTVVALMQAQSGDRVRTFTIGFEESGYNEAVHAKAVAGHLGTSHTELYVRPADAIAVIEDLPRIYSEPFADSSQIPTYLVCRLARQHVTVALSGDGGDELFAGYNRYLTARRVWSRLGRLPAPARKMAARILNSLSPSSWDRLFNGVAPLLPTRLRVRTPGDKAHKLASVLEQSDGQEFYRRLVSFWTDPSSVVIGGREPTTLLNDPGSWPRTDSFEQWMMAMDAQTYMTDDILVKVDRAAMASSLETRVPLLDHRTVELAWRIPLDYKIRDGQGKWLLRQILYRHVPRELIERPKMGFGLPLDSWLRGPLRAWAEDLLDETRLRQDGYFEPIAIRALWKEHLSGKRNWQHHLWSVLMFQAWLRR